MGFSFFCDRGLEDRKQETYNERTRGKEGGRMIQIAVCDDQKLVSEKIKEMILHGDENRYEVEVFSDGRALLNSGKTIFCFWILICRDLTGSRQPRRSGRVIKR